MKKPTGRVATATLSAKAPDQDRVAKATPPVGAHLHRNNAAEWVMVMVLTPFAWMIRGWKQWRGMRVETAPAKAARKPVMIEGLPPRTMN
jgi:hypothetical protein